MKTKTPKVDDKNKSEIQNIVNFLIEKYGGNLPEWGNYKEILKENGLEIVDVYPEMIDFAVQRVKDRQNSELVWDLEVEAGSSASSVWTSWTTKCKRYRVYKIVRPVKKDCEILYGSCYFTKKSWDTIEHTKMGQGYPKYYDSLEEAFSVVEVFHAKKINKDTVKSNKLEIIPKPEVIVEEVKPPEPKFMNNPVPNVIRTLGTDAWDTEDCYQVLKFLGVKIHKEDISLYLRQGMTGEGDRANLTQKEIERIYEVLEQL